jgi:hypothetical protein
MVLKNVSLLVPSLLVSVSMVLTSMLCPNAMIRTTLFTKYLLLYFRPNSPLISILPWPKIAVRKIETKITLAGRHQIDFDLIRITAVDLGLAVAKQETANTTSCRVNTFLAWFES